MQRVNKVVWGFWSYCDWLSHWCLCRLLIALALRILVCSSLTLSKAVSPTGSLRLIWTSGGHLCWGLLAPLVSPCGWHTFQTDLSVPFKPTCWCGHSWSKYSSFPKIHFHLKVGRSSDSLSLLDWNIAGPYGTFSGQTPPLHILCLPPVCRKAAIAQASLESQKPGPRINDWKDVNM